jgi:predicted Zn-dependent peptidase/outer membrane lipoprotein-sorting protein
MMHSRLFFRRGLLAAIALLLLAPPAAAQQAPDDIPTADYDVEALTYPDLRSFEPPEPTRLELDNGMVIFLLEDRELPQVTAAARIGGVGAVYDPSEKRGLASMTGTVMRSGGTASLSPDSLNTILENLGATVETSIGQTSGSAFMSTLADNVDTVLPLFAEVLRRPAFAKAKVQQAKSQQKSAISRRNDNARSIASREFNQILYGEDSPYARTPEYFTIDRITRQDLVDYHDRAVQPSNTYLSVWGDFDADAMAQALRAQFGDWAAPDDYTPPTPPERAADRGSSVNFVQKADVNQSTIYMGHPGEITRRSDDYAAVTIMNEVLSGGFSGRLFQTVRKEKGLAYSVFGNYSTGYQQPGRFFAGVFSQSARTVEAATAVMEEVHGMKTDPPTAEELSLAKESYLNSFVFNFDTEQEVLSRRMTYAYHDYPTDFLQQTRTAIENVSTNDVVSVAQNYLHPDEAHILVVGRRQDFSDSLAALTKNGSVHEVDISIPRRPEDARGGEGAAPTAAEKAASATAQELMADAKDALGGAAFDDIQSMRVESTQQGRTSTLLVALPNKMRVERGGITITSNGSTVMVRRGGQTQTLPSSMKGRITGQLWRSMPYLMANLDHEGLSLEARGDTTVSDTSYRRVRISPPTGTAYTLHLNAETLRPERMTLTQRNPRSGATVEVTQVFRNYQEVSGVRVPFTTNTTQSTSQGSRETTSNIQALTLNVDPKPSRFSLEGAGAQ